MGKHEFTIDDFRKLFRKKFEGIGWRVGEKLIIKKSGYANINWVVFIALKVF